MSDKGRKNRKISQGKIKQRKTKHNIAAEKKTHSEISKVEKKESIPHKTVSTKRLWVFRLISITVIPVLLFLLFEGILRVAGYGFPTDITVKTKVKGQDYYCNNAKFSWRFFPPKLARTSDPFSFPAEKSDNTFRVFVMGASAAAGTPDGAFCFGRILRVILEQQYPNTNFEVIVPAMPAINSHVVLEIAKDCSKHDADLFIIYLGNNEVVGPYGAGTVFTPLSSNLSLIRFGIKFKATKTGQFLTNMFSLKGGADTPEVWRGLEMFLEKQVRADNANLEVVYRHFQKNLEDICKVASRKGIPVIFSTVTSNLKDSPPFSSLHRDDITDDEKKSWEDFYQAGIQFETTGSFAEAVEQYLKADKIDDSFADLQFRLGKCLWALGDYQESKKRYIQARELDTLRFRADNRINDIIRNVASNKANKEFYFVDAMKAFEEQSSNGITGEELFYEHVHMNFTGNYLLAQTINQKVEEVLPERIKMNKENLPSEEECAQRLAYTDWEKYKLAYEVLNVYLKKAPFTNQLYHNETIRQKEQQLKILKAYLSQETLNKSESEHRLAIQQKPSDWFLNFKYAEFLEEQQNLGTAMKQYSLVLDYVPLHFEAYAKLGKLFGQMGDLEAAVNYNLRAVKIYPIFAEAYFNLGLAYHMQYMYDKAIESYSKSIQIEPYQGQAYNNLAIILYEQGKYEEALKTYRNGQAMVPEDLDLHYNLGIMLRKEGHIPDAIEELRKALYIDPNSEKARRALGETLKAAGK